MTPLRDATSFELYSLDPMERTEFDANAGFHGWKILGTTQVDDATTRKKLAEALSSGIAENEGVVNMCFDPRHGIRVTVDGRQYDYVICFECYSARCYIDGKQNLGFLTTESPQSEFDRILANASVELAAPPPK